MNLLLRAITTPTEAGSRTVSVAGLTAWVTDLGAELPAFTREDVLANHRVVTEIHAQVDACLPARFPTVLDEDTLRARLDARQEALKTQLDTVRGASELAITLTWTTLEQDNPPGDDTVSAGTRYLRERQRAIAADARRHARATELADLIEQSVRHHLRDVRRHICPSPTIALSLALLVPRDASDAIKTAVPRAARDVRILINGPWPPYTFSDVRST